jgi:Domain of unknown function (DUF397)
LGEPAELNAGWRKSSYSGQRGGSSCVEVGTIRWRKSTYSNNGGIDCVEVGAIPWRKSTYSNNGGVSCVGAGHVPGAVLVRDTTQHGGGPVLRLAPADWERFTRVVRAGGVSR